MCEALGRRVPVHRWPTAQARDTSGSARTSGSAEAKHERLKWRRRNDYLDQSRPRVRHTRQRKSATLLFAPTRSVLCTSKLQVTLPQARKCPTPERERMHALPTRESASLEKVPCGDCWLTPFP